MIDMTVAIGNIGIDLVAGYPSIEWMGWFYIMQKSLIKLPLLQQLKRLLRCWLHCPIYNTSFHYIHIQTADQIIIRNTGKLTIFKNNLLIFMYKEKKKKMK